MKHHRKPFKWRKWNNLIHRDLGYLCVGLTLVYAVSGIAVNHRADWNPNYDIAVDIVEVGQLTSEPGSPAFIQDVMDRLDLTGPVRGTFLRDSTTVDIFLEESTVSVDLALGQATFEQVNERRVLRETNFLHLNEPKKAWTFMADIYAVALALLAITGMFVLKGRKGIKGRGAWLTAIGVLIPVAFLLLYF